MKKINKILETRQHKDFNFFKGITSHLFLNSNTAFLPSWVTSTIIGVSG